MHEVFKSEKRLSRLFLYKTLGKPSKKPERSRKQAKLGLLLNTEDGRDMLLRNVG
jgi:hypothetical protein